MPEGLTPKQEMILQYIRQFTNTHGYPPTVRDICKAVGLNSTSTVHGHLSRLEKKGYIRRDPTRSRAIELVERAPKTGGDVVYAPLVGKIAAGQPILAVENIEDTFPLPSQITGKEEVFILRVQGDSMIEAGILDGDYIIVRPQDTAENGDIVVALLGEEATVKYFYRYDDHVELVPANSRMQPIKAREVTIMGKVIGLLRRSN
ncbi:LexA repressor [Moorella sp. E308F]|uniref:transcriptional repressor LexA n=1 Tax=unclassified Neomoorella TaxID=2676739 RepID=UPI0010FFAAFA|nr:MULTISPECIES: transcriptional repressor LexA [unclassified Moorella (in: firmicutes)]GEA15387.1 LexA repressor [Moorella sp. E308F]GEA19752.1 LexA repressor [Moorella sp. E306M]